MVYGKLETFWLCGNNCLSVKMYVVMKYAFLQKAPIWSGMFADVLRYIIACP